MRLRRPRRRHRSRALTGDWGRARTRPEPSGTRHEPSNAYRTTHQGCAHCRAAVLTTRAYFDMLGRRPSAIELADRSIDVAREGDDWMLLGMALNARGSARIVLADDVGGIDDLLESKAIGDAHGSDKISSDALENLGSALGEVRRIELADRYLQQSVAYSRGARHRLQSALRRGLARPRPVRPGPVAGRRGSHRHRIRASATSARSSARPSAGGCWHGRDGRAPTAAFAVAWERATQTQDIQRLWPAVAGRVELAWLTDSLGPEVVADLTRGARHGGRSRHAARHR